MHEMNIYEVTNLISWEILWFHIKSTQQQFNITYASEHQLSVLDFCFSPSDLSELREPQMSFEFS